MFIEQGIDKNNKFWKYIVGSMFIIGASFVGQLPMLASILFQTSFSRKVYPTTDEELMHFFEPNLNLFLLLISFVFALGGIYFVVRFLHKQTFLSIVTARKKMDLKRVFFSFFVWSLFTIISTLLMFYLNPADFKFNFQLFPFFILVFFWTFLVLI